MKLSCKKDSRTVEIERLDKKSSWQEQPRGSRLIMDILPVQHQNIGMKFIY